MTITTELSNSQTLNIRKEKNVYWFNITNQEGGTCKTPFGFISQSALDQLIKTLQAVQK